MTVEHQDRNRRRGRVSNQSSVKIKFESKMARDKFAARQFWLTAFSFVRNSESCTAEMLREHMEGFNKDEELPPELIDEIAVLQVNSAYETGILKQINDSRRVHGLLQEAGFAKSSNAKDKAT